VTISDDAGDFATIGVLVAPPAGVVPSDLTVELGGTVSPAFAAAKIRAAIAAAAQLRPNATIDVRAAQPAGPLAPGGSFDTVARVHVAGGGTFVDVDGTTSVHVAVDTLAELDPQILFYSDDPERLLPETNGVLYRNTLQPGKPARLYFYHVAVDSTHRLSLVLRATGHDARVELLGYGAGPTNAFAYVGHVSTLQYLLARGAQESLVENVVADAPDVLQLGGRVLRPGELVAGAYDLGILGGDAVDVAVVSSPADADPIDYASGPELPGDGHDRRGEFDLTAVPPLALAYEAGAPDPAPFVVGNPTIPNLRPGGKPLAGDYGAIRAVSLRMSNPGPTPEPVYFYEMPIGGYVTGTLWFDGDPRPTEIPCAYRPNRYAIRAFILAPGQTQTVAGTYMTDGASSYPLAFGLTSTPPSPAPGPYSPDACNPKPPPPGGIPPSPSPGSSPAAAFSPAPTQPPTAGPSPAT
jgi:hypothetical protein